MQPTSHRFKESVREALANRQLQAALGNMHRDFVDSRGRAVGKLPEYDALKAAAQAIKNHTLTHLDFYLERFAGNVEAAGGHVHWCPTAQDARDAILGICRAVEARTVTKSKSMIGEEIAINEHLERNGVEPIETDLGEYIIQLAGEPPSHITAPAIHKTRDDVAELFLAHHAKYGKTRRLAEIAELCDEAREIMRDKYLAADVGLTGANALVAETGTTVTFTNEGNAELTQLLPRVHVVIASIEKVVPTLEDATTIMRLLGRTASGIETTSYNTFASGPRRSGDADGPAAFHVVLLDNGRTDMLGGEFQDMLRCIRCGACLNHCPVYKAVGGHAYGWVYSGPMGAVLTPTLVGVDEAGHLPNASTFCGRCAAVCPMGIPLPKMMRHWREREFEAGRGGAAYRRGLGLWVWFAKRPAFYRVAAGLGARILERVGRRRGRMAHLPLAGGWTNSRDMPAPEGATFQSAWRKGRSSR